MNFRALLAVLPLGFALAGCGGDSDLDDVTGGTAVIAITALPDTSGAGFDVTEAWVGIEWLNLVPCTDDVGSIGNGDFPADLLHDPPLQAVFGTGVLDYCAVHLNFRASDSSTDVGGRSALVRGTRADGAEVVIESTASLDLVVSGPSFNVADVVLGFDLAAWLGGVDVDAAELDDEGVARIDAEHDAELLAAFESGLAIAPSVYTDSDRDRSVSEDELTPVATPE